MLHAVILFTKELISNMMIIKKQNIAVSVNLSIVQVYDRASV